MRQHLDSIPAPAETGSFELSVEATEVSAGEALTHAQTEDRQWRQSRRQSLKKWMRLLAKWGLMSEAAARVTLPGGLFLGLLALPMALFFPPLAKLIAVVAGLLVLLLTPLCYIFAWLIYVALGVVSRWAKREAILDELPTRRPLLWPGAPRPK